MSSTDSQAIGSHERKHGLSLPILLAGLGGWTLHLSAQLPDFIQRGQQLPGPRYFPTILGSFLCIAGVVELVRYLRHRYLAGPNELSVADRFSRTVREWGNHSVALILALLLVFVPLVRWLGFLAGGTLFSTALMLRLKARWYNAVVVSLVVVIVIALVFGRLFRVPLPRGVFGISL